MYNVKLQKQRLQALDHIFKIHLQMEKKKGPLTFIGMFV